MPARRTALEPTTPGFSARLNVNGEPMFGSLGPPELLILLAIVLVIFGASRLPRLGHGLGEGIRNFRRGLQGGEKGDETSSAETPSGNKHDS